MKKKQFTIRVKDWARGDTTPYDTKLLDDNGKMCCLGFYLNSCGIPKKSLLNVAEPADLANDLEKIPKQARWLINESTSVNCNSGIGLQLMHNNDTIREIKTLKTRKKKIKELFATQNIEVKFV